MATIAFYGPDDRFASKVAVGIAAGEGEETLALERWFSEGIDVRNDPEVGEAISRFIEQYDVKSVALTDGIMTSILAMVALRRLISSGDESVP